MLDLAREFRAEPLHFGWLIDALQTASLDVREGILVQLNQIPEQDCEEFEGYWLTTDRRFFEFRVSAPRADGAPNVVERWEDVTASTRINAHQPGTGKSFGWLALDVLEEIVRT